MDTDSNKKSPWFTDSERKVLANLVEKNRETILSRETGAAAIQRKRQTWSKITREYNRQPNIRLAKTTPQLRRLWANLLYKKAVAKPETKSTVSTAAAKSFQDELAFDKIPADVETTHSVGDDQANPMSCQSNSTESHADLLAPIVSSRLRQIEEATEQRREMHRLAVQREQLQIKLLEEQLGKQSEIHSVKLNKERELHDLRISQEKSLYHLRLRNEQELHQMKLAEFNRVQTGAYQMIYK